jgi:acyl carrier protein
MAQEIEETIAKYICTQVIKRPQYDLGTEDPLISSGLIDSFHLVDLSVFIEEEFGVQIDDTELNANTFDTISQLSELIRNRSA